MFLKFRSVHVSLHVKRFDTINLVSRADKHPRRKIDDSGGRDFGPREFPPPLYSSR